MDLRAPTVNEVHIRFRIVTYNIHKCQGFDRKIRPDRIIEVLRGLNADVLCLQEVVDAPSSGARFNQAHEIARAFAEYSVCFGSNRPLYGGGYGNMTLARFRLHGWKNHDVTHKRREARGVLQADIDLGSNFIIHIFNVHLGTGFMERRAQAARLLSTEVLGQNLRGPRLIAGDFNEWTSGLTTQLLRQRFRTFKPRHRLGLTKTFPGMLPFLSLDHYYYETPLELEVAKLTGDRRALVASDHLPLVADFRVEPDCARRVSTQKAQP